MVTMKQVHSSHIDAIGHDSDTNELHVQFKSGKTFKYKDVDSNKARTVMNSGSIGSAIHQHVRGQHDHEEI